LSEAAFQTATLGLGGNIGDPVHAMAHGAAGARRASGLHVSAVSRLYRTPPWGKTDQSYFFNCLCLGSTRRWRRKRCWMSASISSAEMKRERIERWGPRTLDIDVLTYADVSQDAPRLELPHPRMTDRGFVLMPLADFAPI
jgi:2-amino-4-hydroxy-6-hydroxymethyldihydropteridine diphosphokinase